MYEYCKNNPVVHIDPSGYKYYNFDNSIGGSTGIAGNPLYMADSPENQTCGLISGQGRLPYAGDRFGFGTYGENACSAIATYNALQLLGRGEPLADIVDEYFLEYGTVFWAAFGISPFSIEKFFMYHGIPHTSSFSCDKLTAGTEAGSVYVFTVFNGKTVLDGWHSMCAYFDGQQYYVLNKFNRSVSWDACSSLSEAFSGGKWIYGIRAQ